MLIDVTATSGRPACGCFICLCLPVHICENETISLSYSREFYVYLSNAARQCNFVTFSTMVVMHKSGAIWSSGRLLITDI